MPALQAIQIFCGTGAGNIGDELMMHSFWRQLPPDFRLLVYLHENSQRQRQPYPQRFEYRSLTLPPTSFELDAAEDLPGLLTGTTLITDNEGWAWPLTFLAPRVKWFQDRGMPVDALGVGVDFLVTAEGRKLFDDNFRDIRSWTVRNSSAKDALLSLGVDAERITVGADWAWLYEPPEDYGPWAEEYLSSLGVRIEESVIMVNLFWQGVGASLTIWTDIAATLDRLHFRDGMQIVFLCNECRHPGFDRTAAEAVQARMAAPSTLVPNLYFAPGEMIALLRHATVAVGQRYHFCVESVLAGTPPVNLGRAPKTADLSTELGLTPCGSLTSMDRDELDTAITSAIHHRTARLAELHQKQRMLTERCRHNLDHFWRWYGNPG